MFFTSVTPCGIWRLRPRLLYARSHYYAAIVVNVLLRCSWALTISPGFFGVDRLGRQSGEDHPSCAHQHCR